MTGQLTRTLPRGVFAAASLALLSLTFASSALAQSYTMGGDARAFAMGGAGISLTQQRGIGARPNPASLAFERREFLPTFPSLGLRANGPAGVGAASGYLLGGTKGRDAMSLANEFGSGESVLGVNGYGAFRMGKFEISASGVGVARIIPNASFADWVKQGTQNVADLAPDGKADILAAGYYTMPAIAFAGTLPAPKHSFDNVGIGLRVKQMVGLYSHRITDVDGLIGKTDGLLAPEMGNKSQLTKSGVGADVGLLMRPRQGAGFSAGVVVANLIKPNLTFTGTDRNGNPARYDILQSTLSAGVGYETRRGLILAADLVDIGGQDVNKKSSQQLRVGAEQRLFNTFAIRGGYNNVSGATYGLGLFGTDIAFGKRVPLEVVKTINF